MSTLLTASGACPDAGPSNPVVEWLVLIGVGGAAGVSIPGTETKRFTDRLV